MQQAVIEVIRHLVLEAVPPEHRTPLFDLATLSHGPRGPPGHPAGADAGTARPRRRARRSPLHQALRSRTAFPSRIRLRTGIHLNKTWEKVVKRGQ